MVHWRKTHLNMIRSDNSRSAAIAMQNNGLFNQRSVRKTIDLKRYLLCAHVRKVVAFLLVSIVIFFSFTTTKTNCLK